MKCAFRSLVTKSCVFGSCLRWRCYARALGKNEIGDGQTWEVEVATGYQAPKKGGMTPVLENPEV